MHIEIEFLLIRHGKSVGNIERRMQGRDDSPLSDVGEKQAMLLKEKLKNVCVDAIYYSPLKRTKSTAEIIFKDKGVPLISENGLLERDFGKLDGLTLEEVKKINPRAEAIYMGEPVDLPGLGVETIPELRERSFAFIEKIAKQKTGKRIALVTHMFWIKSLLSKLLGIPYEGMKNYGIYNTSVTTLKASLINEKIKFTVVGTGDDSHLKDFIVVRHGETEWNALNKVQGQADNPLNCKGIKQAEQLAMQLKDKKIDAIYCSDLQRCVKVAKEINKYHNVELIESSLLREMDAGQFQGFTKKEISKKFSKLTERNERNPFNFKRPEGESYSEVQERVKKFLKNHCTKGTSLIVAHQGVNRVLIGYLTDMDNEKMTKVKAPHDIIYYIDSDKRKVSYVKNNKTMKGYLKRD